MLKRLVRRHGEGGTREARQDLRCAHAGSIPERTHEPRAWGEVTPPAKTPHVKKRREARGKRQVLTRRQRWCKSKAPSLRWVRKSLMFHSPFSFKAVLFLSWNFFVSPKPHFQLDVQLQRWMPRRGEDKGEEDVWVQRATLFGFPPHLSKSPQSPGWGACQLRNPPSCITFLVLPYKRVTDAGAAGVKVTNAGRGGGHFRDGQKTRESREWQVQEAWYSLCTPKGCG